MHRKTATILLRIRARGHFVMSITKTHESHYVGVLDNPLVRLSLKGNTGSRPFTEVKPCWTGYISGWVTIWIISLCCTPWEVRLA